MKYWPHVWIFNFFLYFTNRKKAKNRSLKTRLDWVFSVLSLGKAMERKTKVNTSKLVLFQIKTLHHTLHPASIYQHPTSKTQLF